MLIFPMTNENFTVDGRKHTYTRTHTQTHTQIDNVKDNDVVMQLYSLIEYRNNYSKTSGSLWQKFSKDEPALNANSAIIKFPADNNNSALFKLKK